MIEVFGGNPPVCHPRMNTTNPDGDDRDRMYLSGLSAFLDISHFIKLNSSGLNAQVRECTF